MAITTRQFSDESDYLQMRQLLIDGFALAGPPSNSTVGCTVGDLDWWRWTGHDGEDIDQAQLWFEGDRLIAFAWPTPGQVDLMVHPDHRQVERQMLEWVAGEPLARSVDGQGHTGTKVWAFDGDAERVALYREMGYRKTDEALCFRRRSLNEPIQSVNLPDGYRIRHVEGEADLERRVAVHRDAFSPSRMTVEKHRNVMHAITYRPELDLVVVAPDDSFAAYCLVWFDEQNRFGIFEPVGCHSNYRRRGLTKAVMVEGMRRLRELGATQAFVNSLLGSVAPSALYESVGMRVIDVNYAWLNDAE